MDGVGDETCRSPVSVASTKLVPEGFCGGSQFGSICTRCVRLPIVDEDGRLFGRVNLLDLVVIVGVVTVAIAGLSLASSGSGGLSATETTTTNVTLDFGPQPEGVGRAVAVGDTYSPGQNARLEVTDVFRTNRGENVGLVVRAELTGIPSGGGMTYDGAPLRVGRDLRVTTDGYSITGRVASVGRGTSLRTNRTTVTTRATVSPAQAEVVDAGTTVRRAGQRILTIDDVVLQSRRNSRTYVLLAEVTLTTLWIDGAERYGGAKVVRGRNLVLSTDEYEIDGTITSIGSDLRQETTTVVIADRVSAERASTYVAGRRLFVGETTVGHIRDVTFQPTATPQTFRAVVETNLTTVAAEGERRFGGRRVTENERLTVRGDDLRLDGRVLSVGRGLETVRSSVVVGGRLPVSTAREVTSGDTVTVGNQTVLQVADVVRYGQPTDSSVQTYVEVTLPTVERRGRPQLGSKVIEPERSVSLWADGYRLDGTIRAVGTGMRTNTTGTVVTTTVSTDTAAEIERGDRLSGLDDGIGTIRNVSVYGTTRPDRKRIAVGVSLQTVGYSGRPQFGGRSIEAGTNVPITTDDYDFDATVARVGTTQQRGRTTTRTVVLRIEEASPVVAEAVRTGEAEQFGGVTVARLTDVERVPSTVLVETADGGLRVNEHPTLTDLRVTARLNVRATENGLLFKRRPLRIGRPITLDLGQVTVELTPVTVEEA